MPIEFDIRKTNIKLKELLLIEKRALQIFKVAGYDSTGWPTLSITQLKEYYTNDRLWVAVTKHGAIGFAVTDVYASYAHLEELDVDPSFQQQGVGSALMKDVINWARELGVEAITLRTFKTTSWSMRLYKKFGFEVLSEYKRIKHLDMMVENESRIKLLPVLDRISMILWLN